MESKKLNVRDMINVGIFAVLIIIVKTVIGFLGVIPIICAILPAITALVCAPIYALFVSRVEKFGMITILTSVLGLIFSLAGYGWYTFVGSLVLGIIADLITKMGDFKKKISIIAGYCIFSLWGVTLFIIIWVMGDAYFADLSQSMGAEFTQEFQTLVPWWSLFWISGLTIICALIGMFIGLKMMKKHFNRSGDIDEWK